MAPVMTRSACQLWTSGSNYALAQSKCRAEETEEKSRPKIFRSVNAEGGCMISVMLTNRGSPGWREEKDTSFCSGDSCWRVQCSGSVRERLLFHHVSLRDVVKFDRPTRAAMWTRRHNGRGEFGPPQAGGVEPDRSRVLLSLRKVVALRGSIHS